MPVHRPSELRQFLQDLGVNPKKQLSQNFLIDGNIVRKIAQEAEASPGDLILEIGPGPGALTEELLERGAHVLAVEKDELLGNALKRFSTSDDRLAVFCQDIMEFPIEEELRRRLKPGQKAKIAANLPYHLTSPILARVLPMHDLISNVVVMVQDEVARRFVASPGNRDYSHFTLFINLYAKAKYAFTVSKNCFFPAPKIESAVVSFSLKPSPSIADSEKFFEMTRRAFEQRRKMLRGSLKEVYQPEKVMQALEELGLNPLSRPEELSLEQFMGLYLKLHPDL